MNTITKHTQIENILNELFDDAKGDHIKMIKGIAKSVFRPLQPTDFKDVYLSISQEQGVELRQLITENGFKNIVEFGTSFGISTLYLAQGVIETEGNIITTELVPSKAKRATENFAKAGVSELIDLRIGDALETLKNYSEPTDLLVLDGWKDLYLPLFNMLEHTFHNKTIVYVDNADMNDTQVFLKTVAQTAKYDLRTSHNGKVVLIRKK
ncbi:MULTISPECIES: O-methyltransferase [Croceitalea]|uniref:Class I SAM-dependent methyltransferase n=1 Tax=Croceitalea vernalis TaxID=3075599 RepID=A0ABU3BH93_9FLAO|nr:MULTISPECIES: class I SAM-dependent methyltransferase [unclassified Croceitalea]MDT0539734.1 class I SAM-dependent methyltransferase [Croceitalea sp. P059]MDT0621546.1 class I SAM-dependent methyltransferase [Croceitalea sp. P007]